MHDEIVSILLTPGHYSVLLKDGRRLDVRNIIYGTELDLVGYNITTNTEPRIDGVPSDYFYTDQVFKIEEIGGNSYIFDRF